MSTDIAGYLLNAGANVNIPNIPYFCGIQEIHRSAMKYGPPKFVACGVPCLALSWFPGQKPGHIRALFLLYDPHVGENGEIPVIPPYTPCCVIRWQDVRNANNLGVPGY